MPKTREQKEKLLVDYQEKLKKAKSVILTDYSKLKTKDLFGLRDQLYDKRIDFNVVKNRILNLALEDAKIEIPQELLDRPLALAFSYDDEIEPAKIIYQFAEANENLEILGGIQNKTFVEAQKIQAIALLPSHEELYTRFVGAINAPRLRLLNLLTIYPKKLAFILNQYKNQIT